MKAANAPARVASATKSATGAVGSIGQRMPLIDGIEKVTGRARYTSDLAVGPTLVGRLLRSPVAHGAIRRIGVSRARAIPGVRAVVTGEDFITPYGVIPSAQNEWPLARERVRYRGEPLVGIAAIDHATAEAALAAIEVEIEPLPAYFDATAARAPDALCLHETGPGNIEREVDQTFGAVKDGFAAADLVREHTFHYAEVSHGQIELNATIASWEPERERLTIHSVTQVPDHLHRTLARCLGIDSSQIQVIKPFVGGSFGHRVEPLNFEIVTAALARAAGETVKLEQSREDSFLTHRARPKTDIRLKIGLKKTGEITAVDCEVVQRAGGYAGCGLVTLLNAGALLHAIYRLGAVKYHGVRIYTNTPPCGAMRGDGAVSVRHAFEALLDQMAGELALDPFTVRRANLIETPYRTLNDLPVDSYGVRACLDWVEEASGWKERRGKLPSGRGLGMACSHYVSGAAEPVHRSDEPHAVIHLKLDSDASITVLTAASDIGQGASTLLAQIVGEVLALPMQRIRVMTVDRAITPKDNGSYGSRVSFRVGNAAQRAAQEMKRILAEAAARRLGVTAADLQWQGEYCGVAGSGRALDFAQVVQAALAGNATITVEGSWPPAPGTQDGSLRGAAPGSTAGFSYAAQVVEVSVDEDTGAVRVERVWVAQDCGFAINPLAVEGQVQGAVWMGMGQALSEENQYHEGLSIRPNLLDYRIPTIAESPPIEVHIVESNDAPGPLGAKEAGKGALHGFPPALTNAICDAIGIRLGTLPASPDRIFEAIQLRRRLARLRGTAAESISAPASATRPASATGSPRPTATGEAVSSSVSSS